MLVQFHRTASNVHVATHFMNFILRRRGKIYLEFVDRIAFHFKVKRIQIEPSVKSAFRVAEVRIDELRPSA